MSLNTILTIRTQEIGGQKWRKIWKSAWRRALKKTLHQRNKWRQRFDHGMSAVGRSAIPYCNSDVVIKVGGRQVFKKYILILLR